VNILFDDVTLAIGLLEKMDQSVNGEVLAPA